MLHPLHFVVVVVKFMVDDVKLLVYSLLLLLGVQLILLRFKYSAYLSAKLLDQITVLLATIVQRHIKIFYQLKPLVKFLVTCFYFNMFFL